MFLSAFLLELWMLRRLQFNKVSSNFHPYPNNKNLSKPQVQFSIPVFYWRGEGPMIPGQVVVKILGHHIPSVR